MSKDNHDYFQVGIITSTHGLKGEVKVFPTSDDSKKFEKLKNVLLEDNGKYLKLTIGSVKYFKKMVILSFKEYNDINQILFLKGKKLVVERKDAVELLKDEYYISDLIGMKVVDEEGNNIGILQDVLSAAANDVYVINSGDRQLYFPAIKDCIINVDIESKIITAHIMDGLMDL